MEMIVVTLVSILLACIPLLIAVFFLQLTVPRKLLVIQQDLRKLSSNPASTGVPSQIAVEPDIQALMNRYFSPYTLVLPALLVSGLYIVGFLLCDSYLAYQFDHSELFHLFPINLVLTSRPLLYAFVGVYLFNLGTMIRRVYLTDLNEQVFWGALNRLLLSMGISLIFLKAGLPGGTEPGMYFSIGFVSNIFLEWVLDNTLKVLSLGKPKQADLPLQMVRGIVIPGG